MADINPGDLVFLKAEKCFDIEHIGWVISSKYNQLWWEVEWHDGTISTESAENIREYKKEAYKRMKKVVR